FLHRHRSQQEASSYRTSPSGERTCLTFQRLAFLRRIVGLSLNLSFSISFTQSQHPPGITRNALHLAAVTLL
ncbi:MAG: hypothetical protein ACREIM_11540, partial [Nitrospiraceae bacterium]